MVESPVQRAEKGDCTSSSMKESSQNDRMGNGLPCEAVVLIIGTIQVKADHLWGKLKGFLHCVVGGPR